MNQGKYVFAQVGSFLPQRAFDTMVSRYNDDYRVQTFYMLEPVAVHDVWSIEQ